MRAASAPSTASAQALTARRAATSSTSGEKRPSARLRSSAAARASPSNCERGHLGDLRSVRHRLRHRALDQRLVAHRLLVGPRRRDDLVGQRVLALGALLDRGEHPVPGGVAGERPELAREDRLGEPPRALDVVAVASSTKSRIRASTRTTTRSDAWSPRCVRPTYSIVGSPRRLHPVAPAAASEVVEAPLPLAQQLRGDQPPQADPITVVPSGLDVVEQRARPSPLTLSGANAGSSSAASAAASSTRRCRSARRLPPTRPALCWEDQNPCAAGAKRTNRT